MIAHFYFQRWKAPTLSAADEKQLAASIRQHGILLLTLRFVRFPVPRVFVSGITKEQVVEYWLIFAIYLGMAIAGRIAIAWSESNGNKSAETIGAVLISVGFLGVIVFLASVLVVSAKYSWWLKRLSRRAPSSA